MSAARIVLVVAVVALCLVARWWCARRRCAIAAAEVDHPRVPEHLLDGAERTWLVFSTRYCATCGPVERQLRDADPDARVVRVDVEEEPALARRFEIRSAPTVLLAGADGEVTARLVGMAAVTDRLGSAVAS